MSDEAFILLLGVLLAIALVLGIVSVLQPQRDRMLRGARDYAKGEPR